MWHGHEDTRAGFWHSLRWNFCTELVESEPLSMYLPFLPTWASLDDTGQPHACWNERVGPHRRIHAFASMYCIFSVYLYFCQTCAANRLRYVKLSKDGRMNFPETADLQMLAARTAFYIICAYLRSVMSRSPNRPSLRSSNNYSGRVQCPLTKNRSVWVL